MASMLKTFRLLADPTRVRLLMLLEREELNVAELREILSVAQSSLSMHLAQLKQAELVEDRRTGKNVLYRLQPPRTEAASRLLSVVREGALEIAEIEQDADALELVLNKRRDRVRAYFDELAGKFGKHYVPGRSWRGLAEALLKLMPPLDIADLGAGEGTFSQLLAQRAKHVFAVDNSDKMVEFGAELARKHAVSNLSYHRGDMEALPLKDGSVDLAFFSQSLHHAQHPERAVREAWRILRPGGRIAVLELVKHHYENAREMYADLWLGFTEVELRGFLRKAGFIQIETAIVHREEQAPHFETQLAVAQRPL